MKEIVIKDSSLQQAAMEGMDAFIQVFVEKTLEAVGGKLTAENMGELNASQITLVAYHMMREEVMDGGFVQLIHNGLGAFIFLNPFAKMLGMWGLRDLSKLVHNARPLYKQSYEEIVRDCTDEEFMELFEKHPEFDDYDDEFVENEEKWTAQIAEYVDEHLDDFARIEA